LIVLRLIARRVLGGVLLVLVASVIVFSLLEVVPGDAASFVVGKDAPPSVLASTRETLGLDRPASQRYLEWLGDAVRGDFGTSPILLQPISGYVGERAKNTGILAAVTFALMVALSLVIGAAAALRRGRAFDNVVAAVTLALAGFPEFVVGILLVSLFAVQWKLLPAIAVFTFDPTLENWVKSLVLPVATLLLIALPQTVRLIRGSLIEVLDSEFVEALRLRGIDERHIVWRHALPNAMGPAIQLLALNAAWLIGGIVIVENVFNYPGLGQALVNGLTEHDIPVALSISCLLVAVYVILNAVADVAQLALTPRLRERERR
jgi:peptide/nickel transport system permease protein